MRRREENLIQRLGLQTRGAPIGTWDGAKRLIARCLHAWETDPTVGELGVAVQSRVSSAGDLRLQGVPVVDGLRILSGEQMHVRTAGRCDEKPGSTHTRVLTVNIAEWKVPRISNGLVAADNRVRGADIIHFPLTKTLPIRQVGAGTKVCSLRTLQASGAVRSCDASIHIREAGVGEGTRTIRICPHRRTSMDVAGLDATIRSSCLHEVETTKGIPVERLELVGVFKNVPTALISKLRFVAEPGIVFYTLIQGGEHSRTRVHDLVAVRDKEKNEMHLVAHRTRYRTALLK